MPSIELPIDKTMHTKEFIVGHSFSTVGVWVCGCVGVRAQVGWVCERMSVYVSSQSSHAA